jgi:RNA polymerase sigma-70 factor (ECF subfamily)
MTDQQLMKAVAAGDDEAVGLLVELYQKRVFRFLLGWARNREDALDITQDIIHRVCQKAGNYNGQAPLTAWIFTIARTLYIDHCRSKDARRQSRTIEMDESIESTVSSAANSPETTLMSKEVFLRVKNAIDRLPPRQREVVQLRLLGELTLEEISNTVGLTTGGVKSTLHNALRALRKQLADLERGAYVHM